MIRRHAAATALALLVSLAACDDFKTPRRPEAAVKPTAASVRAPDVIAAQTPAGPPAVAADPATTPSTITSPAPAPSADPIARAIDRAALPASGAVARRDLLIRVEVLLDRAHFSPGVIDGTAGANLEAALADFQTARKIPARGVLDAGTVAALAAADPAPVIATYEIAQADEEGPFIGAVPRTIEDQAKLPALGYTSPVQELAERFHMSEALLKTLNPGVDFTRAGTLILVARAGGGDLPGPVAKVEVDKTVGRVRALAADGMVLASFPATVGSTERPAPSGTFAVTAVAPRPDYTHDPKRLTFGDASKGVLVVKPGPNNPVGSTWIGLNRPTYGIHGAPDPGRVGKTASHGCVRLTNWDAAALGRAVKKGMPVVFTGSETRA
ncbi:MAG: L,D-transpeptidase family protein [Caulobacteraceae bacterium]